MARLKMFNRAKRKGTTPNAKPSMATPSAGKPTNGTTNMPATQHPQSHAAFMGLGKDSA
jgi:hypothetical protein